VHDSPPPGFAVEDLGDAQFLDHLAAVHRALERDRLTQNDVREVRSDVSTHESMGSRAFDVLSRNPIEPLADLRPPLGDRATEPACQRDVVALRPQRLECIRLAVHKLRLRRFYLGENSVEARVRPLTSGRRRLRASRGRTTDDQQA
jgi:hypothetical protein